MMWGWNWGWGGWFFMGFMMLIFWGLVVWGIVALVRSSHRGANHTHTPADGADNAMQILDERFAKGEIDADEYAKRREVLRAR